MAPSADQTAGETLCTAGVLVDFVRPVQTSYVAVALWVLEFGATYQLGIESVPAEPIQNIDTEHMIIY